MNLVDKVVFLDDFCITTVCKHMVYFESTMGREHKLWRAFTHDQIKELILQSRIPNLSDKNFKHFYPQINTHG